MTRYAAQRSFIPMHREPAPLSPAPKVRPLRLGAFLVAGVGFAVGALIWIGALTPFSHPQAYAAYFGSSVDALRKGDAVRYKGLEVGSVSAIRLAEDRRSICVEMAIHQDFEVRNDLVAEIGQVGLSGAEFVSLQQLASVPADAPPRVPGCRLPAIVGRDGSFQRLQARLESLLAKLDRIKVDARLQTELQSLLDKLNRTDIEGLATSVQQFLDNKDLKVTIENLAVLTTKVRKLTDQLDEEKLGPKLRQSLRELDETAQQLRQLTSKLTELLQPLPSDALVHLNTTLTDVLQKSQTLLGMSNENLPGVFSSLQQGLFEMHGSFAELQGLLRMMRQQPGRMLTRPAKNEPFEQ